MACPLATEKIWFDRARVEEAESNFYARKYSGDSAVAHAVRHISFCQKVCRHLVNIASCVDSVAALFGCLLSTASHLWLVFFPDCRNSC